MPREKPRPAAFFASDMPPSIMLKLLLFSMVWQVAPPVESISITRALEGLKFNCCAVEQFPNLFKNPSRLPYKFDGLAIDYLEQLEAQLGFRCTSMRLIAPAENTGFSSFLTGLHNCSTGALPDTDPLCGCEVGVGGWMRLSQRNGLVHFIPGFVESSLRVIVNRKDAFPSQKGFIFLGPFSLPVWLAIVGMILFLVSLKVLDRSFTAVAPDPNSQAPAPHQDHFFGHLRYGLPWRQAYERVRYAFFDALNEFLHLMGTTHRTVQASAPSQTVLSVLIVVMGMLLVLLYEAALVAVLVADDLRSEYRTVEDLRRCHISPSDVCVPLGGAIEQQWRSAIATDPCHRESTAQFVPSYDESVDRLVERKCRFLLAGASAQDLVTGKHCHEVALVGEPLFWNEDSFVLPLQTDPEVLRTLERESLLLRERGRLQSISQRFKERGICARSKKNVTLGWQELSAFFYLGFGAGLAILVYITLREARNHMALL